MLCSPDTVASAESIAGEPARSAKLPPSGVAPASLVDTFDAEAECSGDSAVLTLHGVLDRTVLPELQRELAKMTAAQPKAITIDVCDLDSISSEGLRALVFAKQKLDIECDVTIVGATGEVRQAFDDDELSERVTFVDAAPAGAR